MGCLNKSWLLLQISNRKWATALSISVVIVFCVLFSYSQGRAESGGIASPVLSKGKQREATGSELTFHDSIIRNFMVNKIQLKQIYCSYSRTHNIQNVFLHSLLLFSRSTLYLNRNKQNVLVKTFLFILSLHFSQYFYWPLPLVRLLLVFYLIPLINWASPQTWLSKLWSQNC